MSAEPQHPSADITLWAHGAQRVEADPIHVPGGFHILQVGTWPVTVVLFLDHATAVTIRDRLSAAIQDAEQRGMVPGVESSADRYVRRYPASLEEAIEAPVTAAPQQHPDGMRRCVACQSIVSVEDISPDDYCLNCLDLPNGY